MVKGGGLQGGDWSETGQLLTFSLQFELSFLNATVIFIIKQIKTKATGKLVGGSYWPTTLPCLLGTLACPVLPTTP